eukprot:TRINITY_DN13050_c0_g1_i1.p1 TRINITY_DN13050_c0_g1~~TRINITY_DN13050_c0_g1_i1.p1  ORF type:complete len:441 (-),score=138.49 TRINITY_DN13050_c0_g1_i1:102-1424(-)
MGDPLVLKIHLTENEVASYKSFKFAANTKVSEAVETIRSKTVPDKPAHDKFGLFVNYEEKSAGGFWLDNDKTLAQYSVSNKTSIEFKPQVTFITVTDLEGDVKKKVRLDLTNLVGETVPLIGQKFDIDDVTEFALQCRQDNNFRWLNPSESFVKQRVDDQQNLIFRKQFFVIDAFVSPKSPSLLHFVYLEARRSIIAEDYPVSFDQAVQFAALQMQITYHNYDPLVHVANFLNLDKFLPMNYRNQQFVEEDIYAEHRKCNGLSEVEAKYRYVKKCSRLEHFGVTACHAREKSGQDDGNDKEILFGVNSDAVVTMNHMNKSIQTKNLLVEILSTELDGKVLALKFKSKKREYEFYSLEDALLMINLINGYKDFQRMRKKEKFVGQVDLLASPGQDVGPQLLQLKSLPGSRASVASIINPRSPRAADEKEGLENHLEDIKET